MKKKKRKWRRDENIVLRRHDEIGLESQTARKFEEYFIQATRIQEDVPD